MFNRKENTSLNQSIVRDLIGQMKSELFLFPLECKLTSSFKGLILRLRTRGLWTYILKVDNLAESVFLPQKIGGKSA